MQSGKRGAIVGRFETFAEMALKNDPVAWTMLGSGPLARVGGKSGPPRRKERRLPSGW